MIMGDMKNDTNSALKAMVLAIVISLVLIFSFQVSAVSQASDTEYNLLMKRIMKASHQEKMTILDSLISVQNSDLELIDRIFASKEFAETEKQGYYEELWKEKFINAGFKNKYCIIDSMLSDFDINCDLLSDILNTSEYSGKFPSFEQFATLRTNIALKLSMARFSRCSDALYYYNHSGQRSRYFFRPGGYNIDLARQKRLADLRGPDGVLWAVFYTRWFPQSRNSIWLIKKKSGSSSWEGPWFTGVYGPDSDDDPKAGLRIMNNSLYLKSSPDSSFHLIDPIYIMKDRDRDGLYDIEEIEFGTDPLNRDTDGDSLADNEDINPLAAGVEYFAWKDAAVRLIIRLLSTASESINIYVLSGDINPDMEYFSDSPNAIFLPDMKYKRYSEYELRYNGGFPISVNIVHETDSLMIISAATTDSSMLFYFEKSRQRWKMDSIAVVPASPSQNAPSSPALIPDNR